MVHFGYFWKPVACGQTVLPDSLVLIGQKLVENAKIQNATFWVIFKQCATIQMRYFWWFSNTVSFYVFVSYQKKLTILIAVFPIAIELELKVAKQDEEWIARALHFQL